MEGTPVSNVSKIGLLCIGPLSISFWNNNTLKSQGGRVGIPFIWSRWLGVKGSGSFAFLWWDSHWNCLHLAQRHLETFIIHFLFHCGSLWFFTIRMRHSHTPPWWEPQWGFDVYLILPAWIKCWILLRLEVRILFQRNLFCCQRQSPHDLVCR